MAASTPYRRTGWRVISTTRSGSMQDSSIADALAEREVLRQRAARLAHEPDRRVAGVLAARGTEERAVGEAGRRVPDILAGQAACAHIAAGRS